MLDATNIQIQRLNGPWWKNIHCDVLRLDELHPVVSGNKWFKLKHHIAAAKAQQKHTIATFGGAYSNHIIATALAARLSGLAATGIIRGEKPPHLSATLQEAMSYGMQLIFVSRTAYRNKTMLQEEFANQDWWWVPEGGYGMAGKNGAAEILQSCASGDYTHILCACGTGTTLAGLIEAAAPHQHCIGISALKGYVNLEKNVMDLLTVAHQQKSFQIFHNYHFGGYARHPAALTEWMNELWDTEALPTDIVYTGKLMFAVKDLVEQGFFNDKHKLLVVHSGGLQGNRGLPEGTLKFP